MEGFSYSGIEIKSSFSEYQITEMDPLKLKIELKGLHEETDEVNIGWAKISVYDEELIEFEIKEGYDDRESESFKSIRYIDSNNDEYFKKYHEQTTTVRGRVAYIDRISIDKEIRGNGLGTQSMEDICFYLRKYLLVDFVLLFPYPFEWDQVFEEFKDEKLVEEDMDKVIKFYQKLGFEFTYGVLPKPYMCLDIRYIA